MTDAGADEIRRVREARNASPNAIALDTLSTLRSGKEVVLSDLRVAWDSHWAVTSPRVTWLMRADGPEPWGLWLLASAITRWILGMESWLRVVFGGAAVPGSRRSDDDGGGVCVPFSSSVPAPTSMVVLLGLTVVQAWKFDPTSRMITGGTRVGFTTAGGGFATVLGSTAAAFMFPRGISACWPSRTGCEVCQGHESHDGLEGQEVQEPQMAAAMPNGTPIRAIDPMMMPAVSPGVGLWPSVSTPDSESTIIQSLEVSTWRQAREMLLDMWRGGFE